MKITDLDHRNVCILGYGREGRAVERAVRENAAGARITIRDQKDGPDYLKDLDAFDTIVKSPGIPPHPAFSAVQDRITSSTQIFLDTIADTGSMVIGVTGSKGKSTTSTLIFEMLKAGGKNASLLGNIGEPAIGHLGEAGPDKIFVMEMSSYQLMDLTRSPQIAIVTSFFPEHLDYHGSLAAYLEAKKHIARFQKPGDFVFYNGGCAEAKEIAEGSRGRKIPFTPEDAPLTLRETHLIGTHNLGNMAAASLVARHFAIPNPVILQILRTFPGLPHRLQRLGLHHGIEWIDDAISTTPESAIAAIEALEERVTTIILGGQDRGNDFTALGRRIARSSIRNIILFPGSGPRIRSAIENAKAAVTFHNASSMEDAVAIAKQATIERATSDESTPIVLLSTASPSYGMFKNFEEKGTQFQRCILS